jgi:hypothetical protein
MPHSPAQRVGDDASPERASASDAELTFKTPLQETREAPQPAEPAAILSTRHGAPSTS